MLKLFIVRLLNTSIFLFFFCGVNPTFAAENLTTVKQAIRLQQFSKAAQLLQPLAQKHDTEACYLLGNLYKSGKGVEKNHVTASQWYLLAAKNRHPGANFQLGLLYEKGWGLPQDLEKSLHYYQKASQLGLKPAEKAIKRLAQKDLSKQDLWAASKKGLLSIVQQALASGVHIDAKDSNGMTALMIAAHNSQHEVMLFLLKQKASVHTHDKAGFYPVQHAWQGKSLKALQLIAQHKGCNEKGPSNEVILTRVLRSTQHTWLQSLINSGCSLQQKQSNGLNLADIAQELGHKNQLSMLNAKGLYRSPVKKEKHIQDDEKRLAELTQKDFFSLARSGQIKELKTLSKNTVLNNIKDAHGRSLIHWAIIGQNLEMVIWLLESQPDIWRLDNTKHSALDLAILGDNPEIINVLLKQAGLPDQHSLNATVLLAIQHHFSQAALSLISRSYSSLNIKQKGTIFLHAAVHNDTSVISFLLKKDIDIETKNSDGCTALCLAGKNKNTKTLSLLLSSGANPNTKDSNGWTPLLTATKQTHNEIVKQLIKSGANINQKTSHGENVLWLASSNDNSALVQHLINLGVDIKQRNQSGQTALIISTLNQHPTVCKYLVQAGAKPKRPAADGRSALDIAKELNNPHLLECLEE